VNVERFKLTSDAEF